MPPPDCGNNLCGGCLHAPYTITAKFAGFDETMVTKAISSSGSACGGAIGKGASVGIASPGGDLSNKGPVTSAFVLTPGECYAVRGRVAPTLSINSNDQKADFTVSIEAFTSQCRSAWKVSGIGVKNGQSLTNNSIVSVAAAPGDVTVTPASGRVSQSSGTTTITLLNAGEFYRPARNKRDIPVLTATTSDGVRLRPEIQYDAGNPPTWSVASISILYPGEGIKAEQLPVTIATGDRTQAVNGEVAKATVVITDGKASSVTLAAAGKYYRDTDVPPLVADVTFSLGCEAVIKGIVEDDPASRQFGQVVGVTVENGGEDCLGWQNSPPRCIDKLNGREIVLRAVDASPILHTCPDACFGDGAVIEPIFRKPPLLIGSTESAGRGVEIFLAENKGHKYQTWGVSRVRSFVGPLFEVGQKIKVEFVSPVPADPNSFYDTMTLSVMRTKEDVPAEVTVSAIELDPDQPHLTTGFLKSVTIDNPGKYYEETPLWNGVPQPLRHVRLVRRGSGYAMRGRVQPTVTAGIGGAMAVTLSESSGQCGLPFWQVSKITPAGSGYIDGFPLQVLSPDVNEQPAKVIVHTRETPSVTASVGGGGASLSVSLERTPPSVAGWSGFFPTGVKGAVWSVSGVTVASPGSGYSPNATLPVTFSTPHSGSGATAAAATDSSGQIVSVNVTAGGAYFRDRGIPQEFTIFSPGRYYREDSSLQPYVGLSGVSVIQALPGQGTNAVVKATLDTKTSSPNFGRIVSVDVEEPGKNYHFFGGSCSYTYVCPEQEQAIEATLADGKIDLTFSSGDSDESGPGEATQSIWRGLFRSAGKAEPCQPFDEGPYLSVYDGLAGSVILTPGGEYDEKEPCCYCPCDLGPYPLDLVACGIASIVVEISVTAIDDSCPSETATLTLEPGYGPGLPHWSRSLATESWAFSALLECQAQSRFAVSAGASPSPCGVFDGGIGITVPLEATRDPLGEQCCPLGDEASLTSGNYQISITVTVVEQ